MQAHAKLNKLRISPRKTRLVIDPIRGKKVPQALQMLSYEPKKAALPIKKLLQSAVANWRQKQPDQTKQSQVYMYDGNKQVTLYWNIKT